MKPRHAHSTAGAFALVATLLFCHGVIAAEEQSDPVAAEALFQEARRLMDTDRMSEACPKLEESQRLDPAVGTLMYLALCYERTGRSASAWSTYRMAASAAHNANQLERERIAKGRAEVLEPTLSRLVLHVAPNPAPEMVVVRDGVVLGRATWDMPVPVDPGQHRISASAPNRKPYTTLVDVPAGTREVAVSVPGLLPLSQGKTASGSHRTDADPPQALHGERRSSVAAMGTQRWIGLGGGALGVAGIGLGTIFALRSRSFESDAEKFKRPGTNIYDGEGYDLNQKALDNKHHAQLCVGLGGAAIALGVTLYLTAPKIRTDAAGLRLRTAISESTTAFMLEGGWQ